jgi:hypothetical protein
MAQVSFAGIKINLPGNRILRMALGAVLILGGLLGFLPILGFWMVPLGVIVLSVDSAIVRRFRRNVTVKLGYWLHRRWPNFAKRVGFGPLRAEKL